MITDFSACGPCEVCNRTGSTSAGICTHRFDRWRRRPPPRWPATPALSHLSNFSCKWDWAEEAAEEVRLTLCLVDGTCIWEPVTFTYSLLSLMRNNSVKAINMFNSPNGKKGHRSLRSKFNAPAEPRNWTAAALPRSSPPPAWCTT